MITTRITVSPDGAIATSPPLPAGDYIGRLEKRTSPQRQAPSHPFDVNSLPVHDFGPWPNELHLRREDMYGDDGR